MEMTPKAALMTALAGSAGKMIERKLSCSDGMLLAAQHWKASSGVTCSKRVLCLHGWMDNCRSFWKLAPALAEHDADTEVVALDLPGHGLSSHKSKDGPPMLLAEAVFYVAEAVNALRWSESGFFLIGHSMGSAVSMLYSATFPEQVSKLVLLEGGAPLSKPAKDTSKHIRSHVERRLKGNKQLYGPDGDVKGPRVYPSLELAIKTRQKTAEYSPGNQYLSGEAARQMVARAVQYVEADGADSGVQFRHDPRLQWSSILYWTSEQNEAVLQDVQCPVALLLAADGWPFDAERLEKTKKYLQPQTYMTLPGSHHFHTDPDTADAVAEQVKRFLLC